MARMFPHVPAWWMAARLIALLVGATLVAAATKRSGLPRPPSLAPDAEGAALQPRFAIAALMAAAVHVGCLPWIARLPPLGQLLYVVWLAVPGGLLALGAGRRRRPAGEAGSRWLIGAVLALIVGWAITRLWVAWHSPRAANVVDMWRTFAALVRMTTGHENLLSSSIDPEIPGVNSTPLFFQGLPLLQMLSHAPGLTWVQVANTVWMAVAAAAVAALVGMLLGPSPAVIASAAFLFSPFSLLAQLNPTPVVIGPLGAALLGALLVAVLRSSSPAALALLGGVAGLTATWPALIPVTALALGVTAWRVWRGPRMPLIVIVTALASFVAMLVPSIPSRAAVHQMVKLYAAPHGHAPTLELAVLGQIPSLPGAARGWALGAPRALDVPLAAVLAPFAVSRIALRLCGDTLFDPVGAALSAIGIAVCVRYARRDRPALLLLAFTAAALVPGFISSTDTPSLLRVFGAPVPLAVLAAIGGIAIEDQIASPPRQRWTLLGMVLAICAGGLLIFDTVNPRILPDSSPGLIARSLGARPPERVAVLQAAGEDAPWLYVEDMMRYVPRQPVPVVNVERLPRGGADYDVLLWSAAVEETAGLRRRVCTLWPEATLYDILDQSGLSYAHAAARSGSGWVPAVGRAQWTASDCTHVNAEARE